MKFKFTPVSQGLIGLLALMQGAAMAQQADTAAVAHHRHAHPQSGERTGQGPDTRTAFAGRIEEQAGHDQAGTELYDSQRDAGGQRIHPGLLALGQ